MKLKTGSNVMRPNFPPDDAGVTVAMLELREWALEHRVCLIGIDGVQLRVYGEYLILDTLDFEPDGNGLEYRFCGPTVTLENEK